MQEQRRGERRCSVFRIESAVLAATPGATGEKHGDQATTNGHDADCDFLHDSLTLTYSRATAVIGD
jgi:hypothetical protein